MCDILEENVSKFRELLLSEVAIYNSDGSLIRKGRLTMVNTKHFIFRLTLENLKSGKSRLFELPYPFELHVNSDGSVVMDYRVETLKKYCVISFGDIQDIFDIVNEDANLLIHGKLVYCSPLYVFNEFRESLNSD